MFEGIIVALITPFREGRVDWETLEKLVEHMIQGGVNGIVPCGTTGESATLSPEEHQQVVAACVRTAARRVSVIAGAGSNSTAETVALTRHAQRAGADGALLITPYYNKPTQEGLFQHYRAVAQAVELPLVLYNVPGRTGVDLKPETVARIAEVCPTVVGVKEATGKMEVATELRLRCGDQVALFSGDDATFFPFLALGGQGVISVSANLVPGLLGNLWRSFSSGDWASARQLHEQLFELHQVLFYETNPIPVKAGAAMLGLCGEELRLPLTPLSEHNRVKLRHALYTLGLLPHPHPPGQGGIA